MPFREYPGADLVCQLWPTVFDEEKREREREQTRSNAKAGKDIFEEMLKSMEKDHDLWVRRAEFWGDLDPKFSGVPGLAGGD